MRNAHACALYTICEYYIPMLTAIIVIIFLSLLIVAHELGHFLLSKKFGLFVGEFGLGLPPRAWGKKIGETIYSINWLPFGGYVKIAGENGGEDEQDGVPANLPKERIFYNIAAWKRALILAGGVGMNFLFGWIILSGIFMFGVPQEVFVGQIQKDSPAASAGIKESDKVLGYKTAADFSGAMKAHGGEQITVHLERAGKEVDVQLTPRKNPPTGQGPIGVSLMETGQPKEGFVMSLWDGLKASFDIVWATVEGIGHLLKQTIIGKGSLDGVSGPIGIVKITSQASSIGFIYVLQLLALISLNLAAFNILPFPALDGGRLLFLAIEKIKGSPLPKKFEQYANGIGMALLLLLILVISIKDIIRIVH